MNRTVKRYFPIFVLPTLIAFIIAFAVPFVMGLVLSFTEFRTVTDATFVGFSNYVRAFTDDKLFINAMWFTVKFAVISVIGINVFAFLLALLMSVSFASSQLSPTHICTAIISDYFDVTFFPTVKKLLPLFLLTVLIACGYYMLLTAVF